MLKLLRYYIWRFLVKITKKLHIFMVINKRIGLKNLNLNLLIDTPSSGKFIVIAPQDLYLGPDYLVDKYTLLNCPIQKSPHYELMRTINENGNVRTTDYFQRYVNGCLDWRDVQNPKTDTKLRFITKFHETKDEIVNGTYTPIKVCLVNKKYYICDGKHRAAMCALFHQSVSCELLSTKQAIGQIGQYLFRCIITKPQFSNHMEFYNLINHVES